MTNRWIINSLNEDQKKQQDEIAKQLSINPILAKLLVQRGITTFDEAKQFFRPSLNALHDPFLMTDMQKAVDRLNLAIGKNEKIMVYGDYDVDGTTAVALVYNFLLQYTSNITFYIPNRYTEGYGISYTGIDFASNENVKLIITLDCGIKAVEKVNYAKEKGIDFIICDHHNPDSQIPDAVAVLDPKRSDCNYPYPHLSGCGVGFKLMQAFAKSNDIPFFHLMPSLDLLALSIASDIVPITGENRILIYYGLKQLNNDPSTGLKSIIEVCDLTGKEITVSDIVFKIGPRINASGRITSGKEAVELLIEKDIEIAREKSKAINEYNNERKDLDKNTTDEAITFIEANQDFKNRKSIVVYQPDWHKGIVGIVASRLAEEYYKPTVVLTCSNGMAMGSARSIPEFDLYKAIESCQDLLENFGGHLYAAGLSMKEEHVEEFTRRFEEFVANNIQPEQLSPQIEIDAELSFADLAPRKFFNILKQFAPFGPENMKPIFVSRNVRDYGTSKLVGKGQEHLKMDLIDDSEGSIVVNGIAFKKGGFYSYLKNDQPLDICYTLEENTFNGNTTLQLMIRDIHIPE